jgi:toxin ParE1/3/4
MEFKIIWSDDALADLAGICEWIAQDNPNAAETFGAAVLQRVSMLSMFPKLGPIYQPDGTARSIVQGSYRIYYDIVPEGGAVEVLRIRHSAREPMDREDLR